MAQRNERLHKANVRTLFIVISCAHLNCIPFSLIVEHTLRPTPKEMLTHPWIVSVMKKEVPMARWIHEVWGWRTSQSRNVYVCPAVLVAILG